MAALPAELDTAFRVLKGLLSLQDEPLQRERCIFVFDFKNHFENTKPFLQQLEQLKARNPKFVLFGLAFIAEVAFSKREEDDEPHLLLKYLQESLQ